jgi:hypothetical protein
MKRVEGVEDLNSRIICAQGIVGVGATIRTLISSSPAAASLPSLPRRRRGPALDCLSTRFLLAVPVLSRLFRRLFLERLTAGYQAGRLEFFADQAALAEPPVFRARVAALRKVECRVDGGVTVPIPHRPGRADFPHPVLHERGSLAAA